MSNSVTTVSPSCAFPWMNSVVRDFMFWEIVFCKGGITHNILYILAHVLLISV